MERAGEKLLSSIELDYETVLKCQSIFNWLCGNNRFLKFLTETEVPATYRLIDKKRDNEYKTVNYKNFMECYKYIDKILSFVKDEPILEAYTTQMLAIKNETDAGLLWKQFAELNKPISMSIVVNSTMSKGIIVKEDSIATFNSSIEGLSILPSYNQVGRVSFDEEDDEDPFYSVDWEHGFDNRFWASLFTKFYLSNIARIKMISRGEKFPITSCLRKMD